MHHPSARSSDYASRVDQVCLVLGPPLRGAPLPPLLKLPHSAQSASQETVVLDSTAAIIASSALSASCSGQRRPIAARCAVRASDSSPAPATHHSPALCRTASQQQWLLRMRAQSSLWRRRAGDVRSVVRRRMRRRCFCVTAVIVAGTLHASALHCTPCQLATGSVAAASSFAPLHGSTWARHHTWPARVCPACQPRPTAIEFVGRRGVPLLPARLPETAAVEFPWRRPSQKRRP